MLRHLRDLKLLSRRAEEDPARPSSLSALRLFTAEMFVATGLNATLQHLRAAAERHIPEPEDPMELRDIEHAEYRTPAALGWAPALVGTLTGAAHVARALRPSDSTTSATRLLNGAVLSIGVASLADSLYSTYRRNEPFPIAPVLFGYMGALGFFLDREEMRAERERGELERRARLVERFVPKRRPRVDRIVVHV